MADFPFLLGAIHQPAPIAVPHVAARFPRVMAPDLYPPAVQWLLPGDLIGDDAKPDSLGNDRVGNCVPCALLRLVQVWSRELYWSPTVDNAMKLYERLAGYDGTPKTDLGTPTASAFAAVVRRGMTIGGLPLPIFPYWNSVYREGELFNPVKLRGAIHHFGGVLATVGLRRGMEQVEGWTADSIGGGGGEYVDDHEVLLSGFDEPAGTFTATTWGYAVPVETNALAQVIKGADAMLAVEWLNDRTGLAPNGDTLAQLEADRTLLGIG